MRLTRRRVRRARALLAGAAVLAGLGGRALVPDSAQAGPIRFSRLTACPHERGFAFLAQDDDFSRPDTLFAVPSAGRLDWLGGPVRGLALQGDTVYAATLLGVCKIPPSGSGSFLPWEGAAEGRLDVDPSRWPALRDGAIRAAGAHAAGDVWIFPERYVPLRDSSRVFLTDAEHPPGRRTMLYDLHTRDPRGTEYMAVRNLEVRSWVVSDDSLHWALAVRLHRPDYGGEIIEAIVAGIGARVETFTLGEPRSLIWDGANRLWVLLENGDLQCVTPGPSAWSNARVDPSAGALPCPLGPPEVVWAWRSPLKYTQHQAAERFAATVQSGLDRGRAWVVEHDDGSWRPVWGGFLTREALFQEMPEAPVPDAAAVAVPAGDSHPEGTVARVRMTEENGVATLRNVSRNGRTASEFWWQYFPKQQGVRIAGPWGLGGATPGRGGSVDTPGTGP
jgi:hypothetical protein